jgi:S-(hydroxymethyl)glutathione dehydrogenase / alcohol dehydrogenase
MRAAVLTEIGKYPEVRSVTVPRPELGQVTVRVLVSGLCGSQLQEVYGYKGNGKFLPHMLGHEGCGIVEEVGAGVTTVKPGDKVVMHWRVGSGIESSFPEYVLHGNGEHVRFQSGKVTTLAEKVNVSENRLTVVPAALDPEVAALLGCGLTTALGVINNEVDLKYGESVAVIGCGGVGLNLIMASVLFGAGRTIGVDNNPAKRELAAHLGGGFYSHLPDDQQFDIIIDTTGNVLRISDAITHLAGGGRLVLVGQPKPGMSIEIPNAVSLFDGTGKTIKATQGGKTNPALDIPRYANMYLTGLYGSTDGIVTHRFRLDDIDLAFDMLEHGDAGRIMIRMDGNDD